MFSADTSLPQRGRHQFSVGDLLKLTLVVSIVLTIAVLSRSSKIFRALSSPWTWASFAIIAAAWVAVRRQMVARRWLVLGSIGTYIVSIIVPALGLETDVEFGWMAWLQSYVFGFGYLMELIDPPPKSPGQLFQIDERLPFACMLGSIANTLLVVGWIAFYVARYRRKRITVARRMAKASFGLMLISVIPIAFAGDLTAVYPGFGLWAASALLMVLAASDSNCEPATGSVAE